MPAINNVLKQYSLITKTLEAPNESNTKVSARATGLLRQFENPTTLMCLFRDSNGSIM